MGLFLQKKLDAKAMKLEEKILAALQYEIKTAGGKTKLAEKLKVPHSVINRLENGTRKVPHMTISTLEKLFPQVEIIFFPGEKQVSSVIDTSESPDSERFSLERDKLILEKDRQIFELEKENWKLKRDLEEARNAEMKKGMRSPFSRQ